MQCEQIQDIIITDYLDGQMSQPGRDSIEAHLQQCPRCREFLSVARSTVVEPFDRVESQEPPKEIWQRVKAALPEEQALASPSPLRDFLERLKQGLSFPRPVPVLAAVTILLLFTAVLPKMIMMGRQQIAKNHEDQVEYLAYLSGETDASATNGSSGYGTDIEEYFL